ncbi:MULTISPECIES: integrase core domain-containing protein [unclassified Streptomyces]|uniref:integrase core domain-containing protein n=1 Tax=unclassified Streptomyces TaxID=2593676 RepID=UPI0038643733
MVTQTPRPSLAHRGGALPPQAGRARRLAARTGIEQWVGRYNTERSHSALGYLARGIRSPALPIPGDHERRLKPHKPAATKPGTAQPRGRRGYRRHAIREVTECT